MSNRNGWRPLKFGSLKELENKIEEYFLTITDDKWENPASITWLAIYLDTSRETLLEYQERPEYIDTIKKAKDKIEWAYEKRLIKKGGSWDIFALKNFNWKDKTEVDQKTQVIINLKQATDEELQKLISW